MLSIGNTNTASLLDLLAANNTGSLASTGTVATIGTEGDFGTSLAVRLAALQAQSVGLLLGSPTTGSDKTVGSDWLSINTISDVLPTDTGKNNVTGLSATGRNLSLFDPESAYRMMTEINTRDATYKAQSAELLNMRESIASLCQASQQLGNAVTADSDTAQVGEQLQTFVTKYNDWIGRFEKTVQSGGVLEGTQAAEVSLHEFEQSIEDRFNGAAFGIHGLKDLGITIDPATHLASLDNARLEAALTTSRQGTIETIDAFSANFSRTAQLLDAEHGLIDNRLSNLDRAIDYIADNKNALQTEFGLGDPAKPSAAVARAIASYNNMHVI